MNGPCTQYRQKGIFFFLSQEMSDRGIQATWNFHESGHGKGVPDGVGGALKRAANNLVLHGKDITNAAPFVQSIKEKDSSIYLYEVPTSDVTEKSEILASKNLKTVPGTFKLHQIKTSRIGEIYYRDISCVCDEGVLHTDHDWKFASISKTDKETKTQTKKKRKQDCDNTEHGQVLVEEISALQFGNSTSCSQVKMLEAKHI